MIGSILNKDALSSPPPTPFSYLDMLFTYAQHLPIFIIFNTKWEQCRAREKNFVEYLINVPTDGSTSVQCAAVIDGSTSVQCAAVVVCNTIPGDAVWSRPPQNENDDICLFLFSEITVWVSWEQGDVHNPRRFEPPSPRNVVHKDCLIIAMMGRGTIFTLQHVQLAHNAQHSRPRFGDARIRTTTLPTSLHF